MGLNEPMSLQRLSPRLKWEKRKARASDRVIIAPTEPRSLSAGEFCPMFDPKQINERAFEYYAPLRNVRQYIEDNYAENISLKKAAQVAGMERKYFSTFFHKKVGISFKYWLIWVRIGKAISLMKVENHSITQIAFQIGFLDLRTFERAFKKCTGLTPIEFKKKIRRSLVNGT